MGGGKWKWRHATQRVHRNAVLLTVGRPTGLYYVHVHQPGDGIPSLSCSSPSATGVGLSNPDGRPDVAAGGAAMLGEFSRLPSASSVSVPPSASWHTAAVVTTAAECTTQGGQHSSQCQDYKMHCCSNNAGRAEVWGKQLVLGRARPSLAIQGSKQRPQHILLERPSSLLPPHTTAAAEHAAWHAPTAPPQARTMPSCAPPSSPSSSPSYPSPGLRGGES